MSTEERRNKILSHLQAASSPVSASALASLLHVSRQIIVSDVALLRAGGLHISATPRGYILDGDDLVQNKHGFEGVIACKHTSQQLKDELYTIVDFGAEVIDVTIEHSIYGQLSGSLNLTSRYDVDLFVEKIENNSDRPLSLLTEGVHLHSVGCRDEQMYLLIKNALSEKGLILKE